MLQVIADFTGLNIITSDTVSGNLTLRLKDVPWDQALDIILQSKGLDMRKTGNVVWSRRATNSPRARRSSSKRPGAGARAAAHRELPDELCEGDRRRRSCIKSRATSALLSKRGSVVVDERTNTLFVQDTPARLEEMRRLIRKVDIPVRQVQIESRIVDRSDDFSRNLGVRAGFTRLRLHRQQPGLHQRPALHTTGMSDFLRRANDD